MYRIYKKTQPCLSQPIYCITIRTILWTGVKILLCKFNWLDAVLYTHNNGLCRILRVNYSKIVGILLKGEKTLFKNISFFLFEQYWSNKVKNSGKYNEIRLTKIIYQYYWFIVLLGE